MKNFATRSFGGLFLALVLALVLLPIANAQVTTGSITGTAQDPSGANVAGATLKATNVGTGVIQTTGTDSSGNFRFLLLQPGVYTLEASSQGFKTFKRDGLVVEADRSLAVPVELALGQANQVVEVHAGTVLLDVNTSALGSSVDNAKILDVPVNGRNPLALALLVPTVKGIGSFGRDIGGSWGQAAVTIGGGNALSNGSLMDGMTNDKFGDSGGSVGFIGVEGMQELKVITNAMAAEYGNTGGGIVSVISKSGTNRYRGTLYEYLRNSALNANDFFSNSAGAPIPPSKVNQYGGTYGGPIIKNKFFFQANYEHDISRDGSSLNVNYAPTALERKGDFSQTLGANGNLITIYDPLTTNLSNSTRTAFPGNAIPANRISLASQVVFGLYPQANQPGLPFTHGNNLYQAGSNASTRHEGSGKLDYNLTEKQHIALRYLHTFSESVGVNYFGKDNLLTNNSRNGLNPHDSASLVYTDVLTANLLLDIKVGFNRDGEKSISPSTILGGYDITQLGFPASLPPQLQTTGAAPNGSFPCMNINDLVFSSPNLIGGLGVGTCNGNQVRSGITWGTNVDLTKITGAHTFKFGYDRRFLEFLPSTLSAPTFSFTRGFTQGPNATVASANAGFGIASFILGYPATGTASYGAIQAYSSKYHALFGQDDWKVTRALTLNLGLRWEYTAPVTDRFNTLSNFDPNLALPLKVPGLNLKGALTYPGVGGLGRGLTEPDRNNFGPRFGFAYQVNSKVVVRGGYGLIYIPLKGVTFAATGFSSSTAMITSLNNGLTPANTLSNPFPDGIIKPTGSSLGALTGIGQSVSGQVRDATIGYAQEWNLTVQYQPIQNWLVEVAYLGNKGVHLLTTGINANQLDPQYMALGTALNQTLPNPFFGLVPAGTALSNATITRQQSLLPYPQFTGVSTGYGGLGNSNFHAGSLKVEKRLNHGVSFSASYVYGKIIDAATQSTSGRSNATPDTGVVNWYNLAAERAVSTNSIAHRVIGSVLWQLPELKGNKWMSRALGGWQINLLPTLETGRPIALSASTGGRPNVVAGQKPGVSDPSLSQWFNTAAYSIPAAFTFGNSARTIPGVVSDGIVNFDSSIFKDFKLAEQRYALQFRAESFNTFNHVTFDVPNRGVGTAPFGVVSAVAPNPGPRRMQLALRLNF